MLQMCTMKSIIMLKVACKYNCAQGSESAPHGTAIDFMQSQKTNKQENAVIDWTAPQKGLFLGNMTRLA